MEIFRTLFYASKDRFSDRVTFLLMEFEQFSCFDFAASVVSGLQFSPFQTIELRLGEGQTQNKFSRFTKYDRADFNMKLYLYMYENILSNCPFNHQTHCVIVQLAV